MEDWLQVEEFPRYSVSDQGRVRNDEADRLMSIQQIGMGHPIVGFNVKGVQKKRSVAKLVAIAFLQPPTRPHFNTPIHLDGDLSNCQSLNLSWRTRYFAMRYAQQFRRYSDNPIYIRNVSTGEELNIWDLVTKHGILYVDIFHAIEERTVIFPIMERFEWCWENR